METKERKRDGVARNIPCKQFFIKDLVAHMAAVPGSNTVYGNTANLVEECETSPEAKNYLNIRHTHMAIKLFCLPSSQLSIA